jgi:hypothetical protein
MAVETTERVRRLNRVVTPHGEREHATPNPCSCLAAGIDAATSAAYGKAAVRSRLFKECRNGD